MSMQGEIAIEGVVQRVVEHIEAKLKENHPSREVQRTLAEVGLHALTLFDWSAPKWAARYKKLFHEYAPKPDDHSHGD